MSFRATLTRGALALAVAAAIVATTVAVPTADAAPAQALKDDNDNQAADGGGISSVPIVGDVIGPMENASPAEIVTGSVQFASEAANVVVPVIVESFGR